jgi:hypothetical protein
MPNAPRRHRTLIPISAAVLALAGCGSNPPSTVTTGARTASGTCGSRSSILSIA